MRTETLVDRGQLCPGGRVEIRGGVSSAARSHARLSRLHPVAGRRRISTAVGSNVERARS